MTDTPFMTACPTEQAMTEDQLEEKITILLTEARERAKRLPRSQQNSPRFVDKALLAKYEAALREKHGLPLGKQEQPRC